jgi:hypothetical protein
MIDQFKSLSIQELEFLFYCVALLFSGVIVKNISA